MNNATQVIEYLKVKGNRITKIRKSVIDIFHKATTPLSIQDVLNELRNLNLFPNKTTAYREIEFLLMQGVIKEVDFGEGLKRFELTSHEHHHHIICVKCKNVEDISINHDLSIDEKQIAKEKKYKIINHTLEFFGICPNCQNK